MTQPAASPVSPLPPGAVVVRSDRMVANELSNNESVMLDVDAGRYYGVQDVAKAIWDAIATPVAIDDLIAGLISRYEVDEETCRREVAAFLESLSDEGLIDVRSPVSGS